MLNERFLYPLAKRFIAGYDFDSAKSKIQHLIDEGYEVSIDYLGELSKNAKDCQDAVDQYVEITNFYKNQKIDMSIKPSQLGVLINPELCVVYLDKVSELAKSHGHSVRLDMEDSRVTEATRNMAILLNGRYGNVGVAIQANLHRTKKDLLPLINGRVSVRLVKGAYKENGEVALQQEEDIELAFFNHFADLLAASEHTCKNSRLAIASHDEELLGDILEMYPKASSTVDFEFLYGIRRDLQKKFKDEGKKVRIYVPFGADWLPYATRRLKEWKNFKLVAKNIIKEWLS